jgi:acyl carrier protein
LTIIGGHRSWNKMDPYTTAQTYAGHDVKGTVRSIVKTHAGLGPALENIGDSTDLYRAGMTSFGSVVLMIALENEFELEFPDAMLGRSVFESVDTIASAIASLRRDAA